MLRRVLVGVLALAAVLGLAVAGRIAWVGYGPPAENAGLVPVGDAFLAWARTRPPGPPLDAGNEAGAARPWWPAFAAPFLVPAGAVGLVLALRKRVG